MNDHLIIYHGSAKVIEKPIFGFGNPKNDYGLGFYCTQSIELAKEWACSEEESGYANQYRFHLLACEVFMIEQFFKNMFHRVFFIFVVVLS